MLFTVAAMCWVSRWSYLADRTTPGCGPGRWSEGGESLLPRAAVFRGTDCCGWSRGQDVGLPGPGILGAVTPQAHGPASPGPAHPSPPPPSILVLKNQIKSRAETAIGCQAACGRK